MSNSTMKDDKSGSSGGKDAPDHKEGAARQPGADKQPEGQRQQSTGQTDKSGGQHGDHSPHRATQQGGGGERQARRRFAVQGPRAKEQELRVSSRR
jgi:hypothetical protein